MFTPIQYSRQIAIAVALVILRGSTAATQTATADARWEPWIGCWRASPDRQPSLVTTSPLVCVSPTAIASAVQIATIDSGRVVARDTVNADGAERRLAKGGCTGWERAHFSSDADRVYLRSELTCGTGLKRSGTGMLSISPDGEWLDVQGVTVGGNSTVRATRFREASVAAVDVPADIALPNAGRELATNAARTAAGAPLSAATIIEAVDQLDTAVVQTWIVQRGRKFNLDGKGLMALADAGVPGSVTDVLIGVSYPEHFALQEQPARPVGNELLSPLDSARVASQYLSSRCYGGFEPLWSSSSSLDPCSLRYGLFGFAYNPYRYGSYAYGYGYGSGYATYAPVVVVKGDTPHGRVVNGRGYTRSGDDAATGASSSWGSSPAGTSSGSSRSAGASSGSSSGGSSSSSSSSSGGRTAHGRP